MTNTAPSSNAVGIAGLASRLSVSNDKVRRMAIAKEIPGFKVGRVWRFFPDVVIASLQQTPDPWKQSTKSRSRRRAA